MMFESEPVVSHGIAEASNMAMAGRPGQWYLNRLKVNNRGRGYGSEILRKLLATLAERKDFSSLIVEPGGYGSDVNRLNKFYKSNGFKPDASRECLVWIPEKLN
jgi:hypothetical protein